MQYASTIWKRQARRTWRRQVADTAASATRRFAADFAFAASGTYPELQWPLIDHLYQRDSAEGTPPQERWAIAKDRVQPGGHPPRGADRGDLPGQPVTPAAPAGRSIPAWIAALASLPGLLWRRLRRQRQMWRNLAELETLDDRTLKDIGLSRCEIELIAGGEHRWRY